MYLFAIWTSVEEPDSFKKLTNDQLVQRFRKKQDGRYVLALLERVEGPGKVLSRICVKYIRNSHDRQDFIQELYEKICQALLKSQVHTNLENWIKTVVRNACLNYNNRADIRRRKDLVDPSAAYQLSDGDPVKRMEKKLDLEEMIQKMKDHLKPRQWQAIEKRYGEGKSHIICAREMSLSPTQFRGVLNRAVEKLRNHFGDIFWDYLKK